MKLPSWIALPSLPLLTKDLIEMAARKRTYLMRTIAAVLMYLLAMSVLGDHLRYSGNSGYALLGAGKYVLQTVIWSLLAGVYLFLPAVMCPAIASEREAGTLTLIMLTTMRPWQIILQKLGSRLVPVLSLLFIALPLLGVAYTLGGINEYIIWDSAYVLIVAMVQTGCVTLMWSAFCRTPAGAFFLTYLTLAAMYIGWPIMLLFASEGDALTAAFIFHPPALLMLMIAPMSAPVNLTAISVGSWATAGISLVLARVFLVSRQHIQKRNRVRQFVHAVDNTLAGGNVVTAASSRSLPADKAIAWSELHRSALGRIRYLVIILVAVQIPVLGIAMLIYADYAFSGYHYNQMEGMSAFLLFLWPLCAIGLTMIAAGLFPNERNRQTLDVLLTTPIDTRRIVAEKLAGVNRLRIVLAAPLMTVVLLEASYEYGQVRDPSAAVHLLLSVLTIAIYFWTLTWVAMWIGMRTRSARRAVMTAVGVVVGLCIGPLILAGLSFGLFNADEVGELLLGTSPVVFVTLMEFNDLDELGDPAVFAILHLGLWFAIGLVARLRVLFNADRMLGRVTGPGPSV